MVCVRLNLSTNKAMKPLPKSIFVFVNHERKRSTIAKKAFLLLWCILSFFTRSVAQNTDLPNPDPNLQTAPAGSFIIAMDNTNQANPGYFNLKAYGMVVTLMDFDVRFRWVITAGKVKDGVDINVNAQSITSATITNVTGKISYVSGSATATVSNLTGALVPGMTVASGAVGIPAATTILSVVDPTHIIMSASATSTQSSKPVTFTQNSYPVSNYDFKAGPFIIYPSDTALAHLVIDMYNGSMASNEKINVFRTTAA